jgi:hypothetical protein
MRLLVLVKQSKYGLLGTKNPRVGSSILSLATIYFY